MNLDLLYVDGFVREIQLNWSVTSSGPLCELPRGFWSEFEPMELPKPKHYSAASWND